VRSWLVSLAGAIVLLSAGAASSPARADEPAFQRLAELAAANVSANLQALRDDFALAPFDAKRLRAASAAALSDGIAVRAVTFALILVIIGAGLEWLYWTFAAALLRHHQHHGDNAATSRGSGITAVSLSRLRRNFVHHIDGGCGARLSLASERRCDGHRSDSTGGDGTGRMDYRRYCRFAASSVAAACRRSTV
jgi:hypothetical protein